MEEQRRIVTEQTAGKRLDCFLAETMGITRSTAQLLLEQERVKVDGVCKQKNHRVKQDECVEIELPDPTPCVAQPENIPLDIVYEDEDLLVVNKPKGMVVHPAAGHAEGTLVNALLAHCGDSLSGINGVLRPGIVHRIDKDTSGLLIVAKNDFSHRALAEQIKEHSFTREYEAVTCGHLKEPTGTVNAPIGRHPVQRKKMAVTSQNSKTAITHYTLLEEFARYSHVRLRLETGRTHQIRVHMAYLGHPVAGDTVYGNGKSSLGLSGQCLHARLIGFRHPRDDRYLEFETPLPDYFTTFLEKIRKET